MTIVGIDGLRPEQIADEVRSGGRFVFFEICISVLVMTMRRPTDIIFLRGNESGWVRGLPYALVSLTLGWWGLPWGVIYTPLTTATNLAGGCDVTEQVCALLGIPGTEPS